MTKPKLLLIETDALLARRYRRSLEMAGYRVYWTAQAQTAVDLVDSYKPLLIILELQLPGHNGVEFLYELRSYPEWHTLPIIVLSGLSAEQYMTPLSIEQLGIATFLYKPQTTLRLLSQTVERVLSATVRT